MASATTQNASWSLLLLLAACAFLSWASCRLSSDLATAAYSSVHSTQFVPCSCLLGPEEDGAGFAGVDPGPGGEAAHLRQTNLALLHQVQVTYYYLLR